MSEENVAQADAGAQPWVLCSEELPPQGVEVDTKIDDENGLRKEQSLKRQGNLWVFPDGAMYVYYAPTHWRPL